MENVKSPKSPPSSDLRLQIQTKQNSLATLSNVKHRIYNICSSLQEPLSIAAPSGCSVLIIAPHMPGNSAYNTTKTRNAPVYWLTHKPKCFNTKAQKSLQFIFPHRLTEQ